VIRGRNIICIASDWHIDPTSKHQVMKRLAKHNHIIWVNYHGSRRPTASVHDARAVVGRMARCLARPERVASNIQVITPVVLPLPGSKPAAALNRILLVRQIRRVLTVLPPAPVQVWTFAPDVSFLAGAFAEERLVYYCVDEFSEFDGYDRRTTLTLERDLIARASVVVTTSRRLHESKKCLHPNIHLVPHGVDHVHFARATDPDTLIPDDIRNIPRPIIGFYGLIQHWVDMDLTATIARRRPSWSFVWIGKAIRDVSACRNLPNVHFLGRRPYETLPGYCKAFDVGIIPFEINELTLNVNPIKLREYLSAGLPVVSTPLPEVRPYEHLIHVANGPDTFEAAIESALAETNPASVARRQSAMADETWSAKVERLSDIVSASPLPPSASACVSVL
jgi:glycosyltransferase involved in cell wall biosynthesis